MTSTTADCGVPDRGCEVGGLRPRMSVAACKRVSGGTDGRFYASTLSRFSGFTMIEAAISMIVVALMLVAALNLVGASRLSQHRVALIGHGRLLAEHLMAELLRQDYHALDAGTVEELDGPGGWTRTATVEWIDPMDPREVKAVETGAKRITVVASYKDVPQAALVAVRTEGL
jgi:type II secretory pathway pseudopilin PulG